MATTARTTRMTADEYLADPDTPERSELVHGEVVEMMTPAFNDHTLVVRALFRALDAHVTAGRLGDVLPDGFAYRLPHRDDTVRVPDVSFVRAGRLPSPMPRRGVLRLAPDLAVEVLSDSDRPGVVRNKVDDYLAGGTTVMWLIDIDDRGVEVRVPGAPPMWVGEDGVLEGGVALPDLRLAVATLFRDIAREG